MIKGLTNRSSVPLVGFVIFLFGAAWLPAHSSQSYDFRLSNLERQIDQIRVRLDQLVQVVTMQRSELTRPQVSPDTARLNALESQQELIMGRLILIERAWQSTEATVQQLVKEREQEKERGKKDEPKSQK